MLVATTFVAIGKLRVRPVVEIGEIFIICMNAQLAFAQAWGRVLATAR
jgi:hypothetical protein